MTGNAGLLWTPKDTKVAEGVGFEPTKARALPVFKTGAFDHSATLPLYSRTAPPILTEADT